MNRHRSLSELLNEVRRYRIALLDLLLTNRPQPVGELMTVMQTCPELQLFDAVSGDRCVCLRRRRLPAALAVARAVSIQLFCRADMTKRNLLTRRDIDQYFPTLFRSGLPSGYYVDATNGTPILGFVRVDTNLAPLSRIRQHTQELIERHANDTAFRQLISRQQFQVTWLVPTETKAAGINDIAATLRPSGIRCEAQCVPKLLELLVPLRNTFPDVVGL